MKHYKTGLAIITMLVLASCSGNAAPEASNPAPESSDSAVEAPANVSVPETPAAPPAPQAPEAPQPPSDS